MFKAIIVYDRDGKKYYQCPRCGKLFTSVSEYNRHVQRAHLDRMSGRRYVKLRIRKKIQKKNQ